MVAQALSFFLLERAGLFVCLEISVLTHVSAGCRMLQAWSALLQ